MPTITIDETEFRNGIFVNTTLDRYPGSLTVGKDFQWASQNLNLAVLLNGGSASRNVSCETNISGQAITNFGRGNATTSVTSGTLACKYGRKLLKDVTTITNASPEAPTGGTQADPFNVPARSGGSYVYRISPMIIANVMGHGTILTAGQSANGGGEGEGPNNAIELIVNVDGSIQFNVKFGSLIKSITGSATYFDRTNIFSAIIPKGYYHLNRFNDVRATAGTNGILVTINGAVRGQASQILANIEPEVQIMEYANYLGSPIRRVTVGPWTGYIDSLMYWSGSYKKTDVEHGTSGVWGSIKYNTSGLRPCKISATGNFTKKSTLSAIITTQLNSSELATLNVLDPQYIPALPRAEVKLPVTRGDQNYLEAYLPALPDGDFFQVAVQLADQDILHMARLDRLEILLA